MSDIVKKHYDMAVEQALLNIEQMARDLMQQYPDLEEFSMSMGDWCFFGDNGDAQYDRNDPRLQTLNEFISRWDEYLKLTGYPIRFS